MSIIDTTVFDFSRPSAGNGRKTATVRNEAATAVLHVALRTPAPWVDAYPAEFALAPKCAQKVFVELAPALSRDALGPVSIGLFGQYLHVNATEQGVVPVEVHVELSVVPPAATCPTCNAGLPDQVRECRRCGERIRLCPICGAPNTWTAHNCRLNPAHVIRWQTDWLASPGGNSRHSADSARPLPEAGRGALGTKGNSQTDDYQADSFLAAAPLLGAIGPNLSRKWSLPSFAPTRAIDAYEWSAPLAAFGMVVACAIDSAGARAVAMALEIETGSALWEVELPDARGVYPDRGAPTLSDDGMLYVATLGGHITAIDAIRGTLRWTVQRDGAQPGTVYGGVVVAGGSLLVPSGSALLIVDRLKGEVRRRHDLGARLDTAPCADRATAFVGAENGILTAMSLDTGDTRWTATLDGPFDAAPITQGGVVYAATMAGSVTALDAGDGAVRWRTQASPKPIAASPALSADGLLYVPADDGSIHIIAAESGNLIRSRRMADAPLRTSPVCTGGIVFAGAGDGSIYAMDLDYQVHIAYQTTSGARIAGAGLALYGNLLTFVATNGVLYVLKATS